MAAPTPPEDRDQQRLLQFGQFRLLPLCDPPRLRVAAPVAHGDEAGGAVGLAPPVGVSWGVGVVPLSRGRAERVAPLARGDMAPLTLGVLMPRLDFSGDFSPLARRRCSTCAGSRGARQSTLQGYLETTES